MAKETCVMIDCMRVNGECVWLLTVIGPKKTLRYLYRKEELAKKHANLFDGSNDVFSDVTSIQFPKRSFLQDQGLALHKSR